MQAQAWEDEEVLEGYARKRKGRILDKEGIAFYQKKFYRYRIKGVIKEGDFGSGLWIMTDGLSDVRINLEVEKAGYDSGAGGWSGIGYGRFLECMRGYAAHLLGAVSLLSLKDIALELRRLAVTPRDKVTIEPCRAKILEFLEQLPGASPSRDEVIEEMEEKSLHVKRQRPGKRELAPFHEYLEFDRKLKNYWSGADSVEKVRYFPVWLWWNLTMILPLRVVEFLVTPLDCIRKDEDGNYYITIRRSCRKKAGVQLSYHVEDDYPAATYPVSGTVAEEILSYKAGTVGLRHEGNWSLLVSSGKRFGYFTYIEMGMLLDEFNRLVLGSGETVIRLGDTRHLSMMNLILSGGSPEICMELAGHEDIDISSHYYSNLSSLIDSAVYTGHAGAGASFSGTRAALPGEKKIQVKNGWCSNGKMEHLDIAECLKNYSSSGHMGDCRGCRFFIPDGLSLQLEIRAERAETLDEEWDILIRAVDLLRKDRGEKEDILALMAKLQNETYKYMSLGPGGINPQERSR